MSRTVTVKPGDTLSGIAERELGDAYAWPKLYSINVAAIEKEQKRQGQKHMRGPDWIFPGTQLRLP